ncbi:MAG: hypothetical protein KAI72_01450 [Candidatus Pacebacteria bacterium]|nr:hypothetical protein [Candidatus Paceibacterota bacterium]
MKKYLKDYNNYVFYNKQNKVVLVIRLEEWDENQIVMQILEQDERCRNDKDVYSFVYKNILSTDYPISSYPFLSLRGSNSELDFLAIIINIYTKQEIFDQLEDWSKNCPEINPVEQKRKCWEPLWHIVNRLPDVALPNGIY